MSSHLQQLLEIMSLLRDPDKGCPWDLKQDMASIVPHTIEETYELADAIERQDVNEIQKECGDLLFQVIFYAQLAKEQGWFDFDGVMQTLSQKLTQRHPHIFADAQVKDAQEQTQLWEQIKAKERGDARVLEDIPHNLPSLSRAQKISKRAATVGFEWDSIQGVIDKIDEEVSEVKEALTISKEEAAHELGDLMFVCANLARWLGQDAEQILRKANLKFEKRFDAMEKQINKSERDWSHYSLHELEQLWQNVKQLEKS